MTPDQIIDKIRKSSQIPIEIGKQFEKFSRKFLTTDPIWKTQFVRVIPFSDWAREKKRRATDIGIDLVGELVDGNGIAAIQCKCFKADHRIQMDDLSNFIALATSEPFTEMIFMDTTEGAWSENAEELSRQHTNFRRIRLEDFRKSSINWESFATNFLANEVIKLEPTKTVWPHQEEAINKVLSGFKDQNRGKLIMACGTGKTFTSLKIAEDIAGKNGHVLMLVPSLALMSQTIREWFTDSKLDLHAVAVCSDAQVGKSPRKKRVNVDILDANSDIDFRDLAIPVTTDSNKLVSKISVTDSTRMTVVFSTYQSITAISDAQQNGLPDFDLIICDEAHRTTGVKISGEDESNFVKVHDNSLVKGKKRLYMTATPKIFSETAQNKANEMDAILCSMDNEEQFGPVFHSLNFGSAVAKDLLTDYKVIVLAIDQQIVSRSIQARFEESGELHLDNATKIVGCYRALQKQGDRFSTDSTPMRRAIIFCDSIKASKFVSEEFETVTRAFKNSEYSTAPYSKNQTKSEKEEELECIVKHVDGTFNSKERDKLLNWLREENESKHDCRILSNARCLSEGVDVPDLDAIMFMHPRKSQIDIVQAVGRVMRKAKRKKMGYIILPVVIPAGESAVKSLDDNKKYGIVWGVLNALRAHDDRFDASINKFDINGHFGERIEIIAEIADIPQKRIESYTVIGESANGTHELTQKPQKSTQFGFEFDEFTAAMHARIVKKCGNRMYWTDWAKNIGEIANNYIERITAVLNENTNERAMFNEFLAEIRDDLNDQITEDEAIEMLGQHFVTKPVFDALFQEYEFTKLNPVSKAIQKVINALEQKNLQSETETLNDFYSNVKNLVSDIKTLEGRQMVVTTLYEKFFKAAFPKMTQKLGIVYTPHEIVDFIIHSVNDILKREFDQTLGSKGVHIIDPFTGTGTFITRLLQSGLIKNEEMTQKYIYEIHANEIVLLAYYIAAVNIETVFQDIIGKEYKTFEGICLTDTFSMYEHDDLVSNIMEDNSNRRVRQKELDIKVTIGNPPYSAGQRNQNDNAQNVSYPALDDRIRNDFVAEGNSPNVRNLFDNYVRAIHLANSRFGSDGSIVGFVTGNSWLTNNFANGMRKHLEQECTSIYILNLRGDIRANMQNQNAKEGGNVFGQDNMTGVSIAFFVKNPNATKSSHPIYYFDIGKGLTTGEKLKKLEELTSIEPMIKEKLFNSYQADEHGDWLNKRDNYYESFMPIGDKRKSSLAKIFEVNSLGVATNRIAWCINSSKVELEKNISRMILTYNSELNRYSKSGFEGNINDFLLMDMRKIYWTRKLKKIFKSGKKIEIGSGDFRIVRLQPFTKQWLYYSKELNEETFQTSKIYPFTDTINRSIVVSGPAAKSGFSVLMTDSITEMSYVQHGQCFPLTHYQAVNSQNDSLQILDEGVFKSDGITDSSIKYFQLAYKSSDISSEDLFYYVYGLLHHPEYKIRFKNNLNKELPRIPHVSKFEDFRKIVEAGRVLGDLHVNYEKKSLYPVKFTKGNLEPPTGKDPILYFRVNKMKLARDRSKITYNENIEISDIPAEIFEYQVNGKSAISWVINMQRVKIDNNSGIKNDPNDFANETIGDPAYPLKLLLQVMTVSLETLKIVNSLPPLDID